MKIEDLLIRPEGKTLEFKQDLSSPRDILKSAVLFGMTLENFKAGVSRIFKRVVFQLHPDILVDEPVNEPANEPANELVTRLQRKHSVPEEAAA